MMCWTGDCGNGGTFWGSVAAAGVGGMIGCGIASLINNGLPTWFPDPVNTACLLGLAACGLFAAIVARRWR